MVARWRPYWKLSLNRDWHTGDSDTSCRHLCSGFGGQVSLPLPSSEPSCTRAREHEPRPTPLWLALHTRSHQTVGVSPPGGHQETAGSVCAWLLSRKGSGRSSGSTLTWHPPCVPANGRSCCTSAPQAQVCYMFPSGISQGARRITLRILDKGTSSGFTSH